MDWPGVASRQKFETIHVNCTHYTGWEVGVGWGRGLSSGAEEVTRSALSNGAILRVRAVPGAELWDLENV